MCNITIFSVLLMRNWIVIYSLQEMLYNGTHGVQTICMIYSAAVEVLAMESLSKQKRILKAVLALLCAVLALVGGDLVGNLVSRMLGESNAILTLGTLVSLLIRSLLAIAAFMLLGGKQWLRFRKDAILKAVLFTLPMLILNTALGGCVVESIFIPENLGGDGGVIAPGAIGNVAFSLVLMLLVGINEEMIFRGLGLGGLLLGLGRKKYGILIAAVLSSLVFGFLHIVQELDLSSIITIIISLLKIIETAMFGIILCCCVLTNRDLLGVILIHAYYDWVILVGELMKEQDYTVDYVQTESPVPTLSDTAIVILQCGFFVFIIAFYLPRTIKAVKTLLAMPPADGPFGVPSAESAQTIEN